MAVRAAERWASGRPRVAWGVTQASCSRPPAQTAAAVTCAASSVSASSPPPGSPAWPDRPGTASAQMPSTAAGNAQQPERDPPAVRRGRVGHGDDHGEPRGDVDAAAELAAEPGGVERRGDRPAVVERLPERDAGDVGALDRQGDPSAGQRQHGRRGEHLVGAVPLAEGHHRPGLGGLGLQHRREHQHAVDDAADQHQQSGEVGGAGQQVLPVLVAARERRGLRRRPPGADAEREHAALQVAVGRHDLPAHGVVALREVGLQRDDQRLDVGLRGVGRAVGDRVAVRVDHLRAAGDRPHLLVELDRAPTPAPS